MDDICFRIIYKNTDYIKKGILNRKVRIRMKEILYKSTRSDDAPVSASKAILMGLAKDGGLFVPTAFPTLDVSLADLAKMDYRGVAYEVMKLMLSDFTEEELKACISNAYGDNFDDKEIVPVRSADGACFLELFHGPTIAFKDMALQILPHLLTTSARKNHEQKEIVILTATSGDTGKAAMAGFADVKGTRIMVFYPKDGVSSIQERQMVTQKGDNTCVVGIRGNFDDAQSEVKKIFGDPTVRVAPTCVRVPVLRCHSESINLEFDRPVAIADVKAAIAAGEHVVLEDDPAHNVYPMPAMHAGSFDTFVGRIRRDPTIDGDRGVSLWVVADQLLRGAALNAVMIAQLLLPKA